MIIVLLGPPGVGKGTQSRRICKQYQIPHVSTGELLRQAIREGNRLGQEVAKYMDHGQLAPDQIVIDLVADVLVNHPEGCLLDGFPRTIPQADQLEQMLGRVGTAVTVVVEMRVPRAEIERRLLERARIEGRVDDTPEAIARRLEVYQERTEPLIDFYGRLGRLESISGLGPPEDVFQRICQVIDCRSGRTVAAEGG